MDEKGKEAINEFDRLLTTNRIRMMKVFLSFLPPGRQGIFAVCIRFSELQYALQYIRRFPGRPVVTCTSHPLSAGSLWDGSLLEQNREGIMDLLDELLPFSGPEDRTMILNLKNFLTSLSRMREMMEMTDMIKEMFPDGINGGDGISDLMGMAMGDSGADPSAILEMLKMFSASYADTGGDEPK